MGQVATTGDTSSLVDVIDRILDKGLVINADIVISLVGVELLGIKIRAALASFETAAKYGLEFPTGTILHSAGAQSLTAEKTEKVAGQKAEATT